MALMHLLGVGHEASGEQRGVGLVRQLITAMAIVLPAWGATIHPVNTLLERERISTRSAQMAQVLKIPRPPSQTSRHAGGIRLSHQPSRRTHADGKPRMVGFTELSPTDPASVSVLSRACHRRRCHPNASIAQDAITLAVCRAIDSRRSVPSQTHAQLSSRGAMKATFETRRRTGQRTQPPGNRGAAVLDRT